jgi:hypothetical protein
MQFYQAIEAINFLDAQWGTANALPITVEFWVYGTVAGTYALSICNGAGTRSYVATYTLPAAAWTKIRLTIPGDTLVSSTNWAVATNAAGVYLRFALCVGSAYTISTPNTWQAGNLMSATGAVNVLAAVNNNFQFTGVALMVGAAAANAESEFKKFSDNLLDCQRYFQTGSTLASGYNAAGLTAYSPFIWPVVMRATPTISFVGISYSNASGLSSFANTTYLQLGLQITALGYGYASASYLADADF